MFSVIFTQIIIMLLILFVGIICYRTKIIDEKGNNTLANLLLMVVNPMVILNSFQTEYRPELISGLLVSFALALLTELIMILITNLVIRKKGNVDYGVERFSVSYPNCGFIGIPLIQALLGNEGVFYLTAYITAFTILSWTHGYIQMTGSTSWKDIRKGLFSPIMICCILGLILFFLRIQFPSMIQTTIGYIAGINTPLAMIVAGVSVAQTNVLNILKNRRIYLISFLKLIIMPAVALALVVIFPVNTTVAYMILIASACPSAASATSFAIRFHRNASYASEIYAMSTFFSLVTIPAFVYIAERLL